MGVFTRNEVKKTIESSIVYIGDKVSLYRGKETAEGPFTQWTWTADLASSWLTRSAIPAFSPHSSFSSPSIASTSHSPVRVHTAHGKSARSLTSTTTTLWPSFTLVS